MGIFISADPAMDGLNWYAYCGNNPMNYVDPWGLMIRGRYLATIFFGPQYKTGPSENPNKSSSNTRNNQSYGSDSSGSSINQTVPLTQGEQGNELLVDGVIDFVLEHPEGLALLPFAGPIIQQALSIGRWALPLGFVLLLQGSEVKTPDEIGNERNNPGPEPKMDPIMPDPKADPDDDTDDFILVSHYTNRERAQKIMEEGVIKPSRNEFGFGETHVFVMEEPSTSKQASDAGAKVIKIEVKITFKVKRHEVVKDPGTSVPNAKMFYYPGPVNIRNREAVVQIMDDN